MLDGDQVFDDRGRRIPPEGPRLLWPVRTRWVIAALAYVVLEGVLGAAAFSAPDAKPLVEWTAFLLLVPGVFVTFPAVYAGGAVAWQVRAAMANEPMWPVTVIFSAMFVGSAAVNVVLVRLLASVVSRHGRHATHRT